MKISELKYASLLSYSPHGNTTAALESKALTYSLKQDRYEGQPPILMSDWVAKKTQEKCKHYSSSISLVLELRSFCISSRSII